MDFQNCAGGKTGGGGQPMSNPDRRERLRQLALETIDLNKDPYFMKTHVGSCECKLCLTLHNNEGSYLADTRIKKHQGNLARCAAKEAPSSMQPEKPRIEPTVGTRFRLRSAVAAVPDRLSGNNRRYYSAASLHVGLRAENLTLGSHLPISAVSCDLTRRSHSRSLPGKWRKPRANFGYTGHQVVLPAIFVQVGTEDNSTTSAEYARTRISQSGSTVSDGNGAGSTSYVSNTSIEVD